VVIESDDWGMVRMASKRVRDAFEKKGYPIHKSVYSQSDALEQNEDLEALMNVLSSVKDQNSNPAKFTINNIVANPDFEKIRTSNFDRYFLEPFTSTLERHPSSDKVMEFYKQGVNENLFQIQFHGREHVQVNNWLSKLRNGDKQYLDAFGEGMFTLNNEQGNSCKFECLDAMATYNVEDFNFVRQSISKGLGIFKNIWGFRSESVIAPCYTWAIPLEDVFFKSGIKYIQGARAQREPISLLEPPKIKRHFLGSKNKDGLLYLIRNVNFEQAENPSIDIVASALKEIESAFFWGKPAIISSHRVNYIGSIDPDNRKRNLSLLKNLLKKIIIRHPTVEFMSTDELGKLIEKN
jgi:hypothetical protein